LSPATQNLAAGSSRYWPSIVKNYDIVKHWKPFLKRGRVIVPANGWYEWTGEKGNKLPWHIHRSDDSPIYMAALALSSGNGSSPNSPSSSALIPHISSLGTQSYHGEISHELRRNALAQRIPAKGRYVETPIPGP
jgi:hypothetical protein